MYHCSIPGTVAGEGDSMIKKPDSGFLFTKLVVSGGDRPQTYQETDQISGVQIKVEKAGGSSSPRSR